MTRQLPATCFVGTISATTNSFRHERAVPLEAAAVGHAQNTRDSTEPATTQLGAVADSVIVIDDVVNAATATRGASHLHAGIAGAGGRNLGGPQCRRPRSAP
jgi:hypothetical protein